ncbi:uncharacterized protein BO96DRAFT_66374 [Aspergillus niger CBS 101883]|uniref:uncharacterized protein n=1 Tax=Aspergillus lacticoffeatus (strain CBS 101883) TaxID=1450533 RepID=UPI000D7EEEA9|nr:uncharacterized protein BO96DRAFT_66374 [Aspergillus niger CBS 101883]PYH55778.1 hypothetical protein BO96DRAFT_66374 [Aspergillus niger CBS 101883]
MPGAFPLSLAGTNRTEPKGSSDRSGSFELPPAATPTSWYLSYPSHHHGVQQLYKALRGLFQSTLIIATDIKHLLLSQQ